MTTPAQSRAAVRIRSRIFFDEGVRCYQRYVVEVKKGARWLPYGDEKGIMKFATEAEAEIEATELVKELTAALQQAAQG